MIPWVKVYKIAHENNYVELACITQDFVKNLLFFLGNLKTN